MQAQVSWQLHGSGLLAAAVSGYRFNFYRHALRFKTNPRLDCAPSVILSYTMRETLTVSLPGALRRNLDKMAKAEGVTASEFVRNSVKVALFRRSLQAARRELVPQARAQGVYTDEDVFKIIS